MFYRSTQNSIQGRFIVKFDFCFGRVNIDVYGIGWHLKVNKITRLRTVFQQTVVSCHHGMVQITAFYKAIIDEEKLFSPIFLGKLGLANETLNVHDFSFFVNRHQFFIGFTRKNVYNSLSQTRSVQIEHFASIVIKSKVYFGVCQGHALKLVNNMTVFHRIRFQKIATGRNIKKQVFNSKRSSLWQNRYILRHKLAAFNDDMCSQFFLVLFGFHIDVGNRCNRCQCFSTKPFSMQRKQILRLPNFGSCVTFKTQTRIGNAHSFSVVNNLN